MTIRASSAVSQGGKRHIGGMTCSGLQSILPRSPRHVEVNCIPLGKLYYRAETLSIRALGENQRILQQFCPVFSLSVQFTDYSQSLHDLAIIVGYSNHGFRKSESNKILPTQPIPLQHLCRTTHTPKKPRPKGRGFLGLFWSEPRRLHPPRL